MDFVEKAQIKLDHWIKHNDNHQEEYQLFSGQLEETGKKRSAEHIKKMIALEIKSNDHLRMALKELKQ